MNRTAKSETDLRRQVEGILKCPVPDPLWKIAKDERIVSEVLTQEVGAETAESLAEKLRRWMSFGEAQVERSPQFIIPDRRQRRGKAVQTYREAVSEAIASIVRQKTEVQSFRREILAGKILEFEEVEPWIKERQGEENYPHAVIVRLRKGFQFDNSDPFQMRPLLASVKPDDIEGFASVDCLDYAKPDNNWVHRVPVGRDGILRGLYKLSKYLATYFHWQQAQATVFLLTDFTPMIDTETITTSLPPYVTLPYGGMEPLACLVRVRLTIDPMMIPEELARKYADVRNRLLKQKPRSMAQKHQSLAVFATKYPSLSREVMDKWEKEFPQWKYRRLSQFARDARVARSRLLHRSSFDVLRPLRKGPPQAGNAKEKNR